MATLRVDVEAARARAELERTARAVNDLTDEMARAQRDAHAAAGAFDRAGDNVRQLERRASAADREVGRLRSALAVVPTSGVAEVRRQLREAERNANGLNRQLDRARDEALRLGTAAGRADDEFADMRRHLLEAEAAAALLRRTVGRLDTDASSVSNSIRRGFLGLGESVSSAFTSAPIVTGIIAALIAAGPSISAALSAAIGVGLGGVGIAAGVIAAVKDPRVKSAFSVLGDTAAGVFAHIGDSFKDPLIRSVGDAIISLRSVIGPQLVPVFAQLATAVEPLSKGLIGFVEKALPGLKSALEGSVPLLKAFAEKLPALGKALGDFLDKVVNSPGAMRALDIVMDGLIGTITVLGNVIAFLSWVFENQMVAIVKVVGVMKDAVVAGLRVIITNVLDFAVVTIGALAAAFSWVPGLGPKLKTAVDAVAAFRDRTNASLNGISGAGAVQQLGGVLGTAQALQGIGTISIGVQAFGTASARSALQSVGSAAAALPGGGTSFRFRQHGGPVFAGQAYVVGEGGAELFVPGVNGRIVPNVSPSGAGGAGGVTINNYITAGMGADGREIGGLILAELRKAINSRGGSVQAVVSGRT